MRKVEYLGLSCPEELLIPAHDDINGVIPRTELRLHPVSALTGDEPTRVTAPTPIGTVGVFQYLRTLPHEAFAVINGLGNNEVSTYSICGIGTEENMILSNIVANALASAIGGHASSVSFIYYNPEQSLEPTESTLKEMSLIIQIFHMINIPVENYYLANAEHFRGLRKEYPSYFIDLYLDVYLAELKDRFIPELLSQLNPLALLKQEADNKEVSE